MGSWPIFVYKKMIIFAFVLIHFFMPRTADSFNYRVTSRYQELQRKLHFEQPPRSWMPSQTLASSYERHGLADTSTSETNENNLNILRQYWAQKQRPKSADAKDCVHRGSTVRLFPGDCYSHMYNVEKSQAIWWRVWDDIMQDFAYTFDFVLAPVNKNDDVPGFYLIIKFLKTLVFFVDNPLDVLRHKKFHKDMSELNNDLSDLAKQFRNYKGDMASLRSRQVALFVHMHKFQSDKLSLNTDISRTLSSLTQIEDDKTDVENKVNEISIQTHSIKDILQGLGNIVQQNYYIVKDGMPPPGVPGVPGQRPGSSAKKQQVKSITFPTNVVANIGGGKVKAERK